MKRVQDSLWDECNGNVEAYEARREFYGYLSPCEEEIEIDSFDLDGSYSTLMNEDEYFYTIGTFHMDEELWEYSLKGVSALKVY